MTVKITIFRPQFLFGYSYWKKGNGDKKTVQTTKKNVCYFNRYVCIGTKRDCQCHGYSLLWQKSFLRKNCVFRAHRYFHSRVRMYIGQQNRLTLALFTNSVKQNTAIPIKTYKLEKKFPDLTRQHASLLQRRNVDNLKNVRHLDQNTGHI